jgi:hypothetical protein
MPRIFIVVCPKCQGGYPCHFDELRHKDIKLICPYCENRRGGI